VTSFTFSIERIRSAPPEVRRWIESEIAQAVAMIDRPRHDPSQVEGSALAACASEEAMRVFELIQGNFLLTQVFFELARETGIAPRMPPLYPLNIGDILRHTRLSGGHALADCLSAINQAFRQVRGDPDASLFGFDDQGHVYIHEITHLSIRRVWEQLVRTQTEEGAGQNWDPPAIGFAPPHVGPSEAVATHAADRSRGADRSE